MPFKYLSSSSCHLVFHINLTGVFSAFSVVQHCIIYLHFNWLIYYVCYGTVAGLDLRGGCLPQ